MWPMKPATTTSHFLILGLLLTLAHRQDSPDLIRLETHSESKLFEDDLDAVRSYQRHPIAKAMEEVAVFRASKRRKVARPHREASPESAPRATPTFSEIGASKSVGSGPEQRNVGDDDDEVEVTNLIRARKNYRKPVTGVRFSNTKDVPEDEARNTETAMIRTDQPPEQSMDITSRFVSSTGQVVNVDRHMYEHPS